MSATFLLALLVSHDVLQLGSTCDSPMCTTIEHNRKLEIKNKLLSHMGLSQPPTLSSEALENGKRISKTILPFLGNNETKDDEDSITYVIGQRVTTLTSSSPECTMFNVSNLDIVRNTQKITLNVFLDFEPLSMNHDVLVEVFEVFRNESMSESIVSTTATISAADWVSLNILPGTLLRWNEDVIGIHVVAKVDDRNVVVYPRQDEKQNERAMYLTVAHTPRGLRRKRDESQNGCSEPNSKGCCLRDFYVDFHKSFNWTFVVAPEGYHANICSGDCSLNMYSNEHSSHTKATREMMYRSSQRLESCCYADAFESTTIVFMKENHHVVVQHVPAMKATRCTCK